jgi:threonine/homoserine/homoserine lactone efflux protein
MGIHDLWLFMATGLLLNITPGPDMALVIARSTQLGKAAGIAAALGVGAGCFVHIAAAAIGISAIVMTSAWAFSMLKWAGALYLIYVGIRILWSSWRPAASTGERGTAAGDDLRSIFLQGVLTNALNPKVAVFFLAFLPQFIDADAPSKVMAFVILGLLFNATGTVWNVGVACLAGRAATSAAFAPVRVWLERTIGALFVALGTRLALAERP